MKTTYEQLYMLSSPVLKAYRDDLEKCDRQQIKKYPDLPFLHWTRESGTHLQLMPPANHPDWPKRGEYVPFLFGMANREHILNSVVTMAQMFVKPCYANAKLVLHFDGWTFLGITAEEALEIAREYRDRISAAWRKSWSFVPREVPTC